LLEGAARGALGLDEPREAWRAAIAGWLATGAADAAQAAP
jgi:hypothetical protein